jgi:hypothetical protein
LEDTRNGYLSLFEERNCQVEKKEAVGARRMKLSEWLLQAVE